MRALILRAHGGLDGCMVDATYPDPVAGSGEAVIRVQAASLNRHDLFTIEGMPGIRLPLPVVLGSDMAGTIASLGPGVTGWTVGQRVLVDPIFPGVGLMGELIDGGLAELCRVKAEQLVALPDAVSTTVSAALPVAYATAHRMMVTRGRIAAGETVLVLGAAGGVGTGCVKLAKMAGCTVVATAGSMEKLEWLRTLGADHLVNDREQDVTNWVHDRFGKPRRRSTEGGVDAIVNYTGGETWTPMLRALKAGGRILTCGASAGFAVRQDQRYVFMHELQIIGSNAWRRPDLEALVGLCASGALTPAMTVMHGLDEAVPGLQQLHSRANLGKIVIQVAPAS